jgi:hypothetical protein
LDQGYFVIPQFSLEDECRVEEAEELCLDEEVRAATERWHPYSPFAVHHDGHFGSAVRNTFIHTGVGAREGSRVRSQSLTKDFGSSIDFSDFGSSLPESESLELELPSTPAQAPLTTFTPGVSAFQFSPVAAWADAGEENHSCEYRSAALKTASPNWTWGDNSSRFKFCVDEPLDIEKANTRDNCSPAVTASPWTPRPNPMPLINLSRQAFRLSDFV